MSLIYSPKPFYSLDHVCPKLIIEEEVGVDVPPPSVVNKVLSFGSSLLTIPWKVSWVIYNLSIRVLSRRTTTESTLYVNG